jgi:hypothetical protein
MSKKAFFIIFVSLLIAGCSKTNDVISNSISSFPDEWIINPIVIDGLTFNLADDYTIEWSFWVNDYIEKFLEFSPEMLEYKSEIEYAVCQIQNIPETDPVYQELGWTKTIQIKITIKNETTLPQDWDIAGTELFYYLGAGRIPGCIFQTRQEHLFSGCLDESINLFTDNSFRGIDEIKPYTFKKQTPQITSRQFRQLFQEQFSKFGGRQLDTWTRAREFDIEKNLILYLLIDDDDDILYSILLKHDDTTKPLQYENDFYLSLCSIISIAEPYLEKHQVEQFATTLVNEKSYLEEYREREQVKSVSSGYWMPSGNDYYVGQTDNSFRINVFLEIEE